ncbi:DICT sensory domain-containing protein [Nocardioides sp. 1609]|uniref:DICT sensory domain-containing protein n=1 Tax=Nocardioides sp. 1609 TaxID=2508327 RepID=UPI0014301B69|nr:DICT sensory domain-containing protein [Nocardioides sp. 1609]
MSSSSQESASDDASLSIGDLAERTGVSAATLRVWESRHGFPVPHRRASGHRRYDAQHVATVRDVVRRREEGIRLDVAIRLARAATHDVPASGPPGTGSVFARLRQTHPGLMPQRLRKSTLLGVSWAIEDEFCSHSQRAHVFGAFQKARHYRSAQTRWSDLARTNTSTYVFADFPDGDPGGSSIVSVPLASDHPMIREWAVVCDGAALPVALTAWELPGQSGVRDADRVFESVWTVDPTAVREASRVCAGVAAEAGAPGADALATELAGPLSGARADVTQMTSLFNRVVGYVDGTPQGR